MELPDEIWQKMLLLLWVVLIGWSLPLAILALIKHRQGKNVKAMWIKYGSWFIMLPIVTVPLIIGETVMQAMFLVMSLYAFEEFSRAVGLWKEQSHMWLGRICIGLVYIPVFTSSFGLFTTMPAYIILAVFMLPILLDTYRGMIQRSCLTILGIIYFGWFLAHLAFLLNIDTGRELVLAFLLVVIINDASAYVFGSNFGRRRMVPNLSPNKTWEGAIIAMLVTIGVTFAVRFALGDITMPQTLLLGSLLAIGGTCGDLTISLIKRDVQIKDTGSLIPGHGGLLDRLDSILFATPIFFHLINYLNDLVDSGM